MKSANTSTTEADGAGPVCLANLGQGLCRAVEIAIISGIKEKEYDNLRMGHVNNQK